MANIWEGLKQKLAGSLEVTKRGFSFAAEKTKKGANIARKQVDIKLEQGKIKGLQAELGKHVYDLLNNGIYDMSNDSTIKSLVDQIKKSDDRILRVTEEIKSA